jgi:hypothetical protein
MVAEQPRESGLHLSRLRLRARPLGVHELRGIEPGALLRRQTHVGPRLV